MRVGIGYDVHRMVEGRTLVLGGIVVPYGKGLLGHSDADVLVHAIMDALLGAAALGDIGRHFPDSDGQYKDIDSLVLLKKVHMLISNKRMMIANIDATIVAQRPRLAPYIDVMRENIADTLAISPDQINIKATTEEGMGFTGTGEGMSCQAICLLNEISENYDMWNTEKVGEYDPDTDTFATIGCEYGKCGRCGRYREGL